MFENGQALLARMQYQPKERDVASFNKFPLGENTAVPAQQLDPRELDTCIDFLFNPGGRLKTRKGFVKHTTSGTGASIKKTIKANIDGSVYTVIASSDKVYYLNGTTVSLIGTVAGTVTDIIPFNDACLVCDGSYLKYISDLSTIKICYDAGTDGTPYSNLTGVQDANLSAARVAAKFTTTNWDAGYTMPPTQLRAYVLETASSASITARIRKVSDDSIIAEKAYTLAVSSTSAELITFAFTSADVTTEMLPNTDYYASLEGSNFRVECTTVASGGVAYTYTGSWSADTTKNPCLAVWPDVPPKADWGKIHKNAAFIYDPDEPGRLQFSDQTFLDWSTIAQAGYIGMIDDAINTYHIGAAEELYGELIVFGTEDWPAMAKLTGTSPASYALTNLFQSKWSLPGQIVNTNNELWSGSRTGVNTLGGVTEFGDLRTFAASDPIEDRFENWTSTTFMGYKADDGQLWVYMPDYTGYISICHVKQPFRDADGRIRYPWTRYTCPITPTSFNMVGDTFYIGANDGHLYTLTGDYVKDLGTTSFKAEAKTAYLDMLFRHVDIDWLQTMISCETGVTFRLKVYTDGSEGTPVFNKSFAYPMSDTVTLGEVEDVTLEEVQDFILNPSDVPMYFETNINCFSMQLEITEIATIASPVFFDGLIAKVRKLED